MPTSSVPASAFSTACSATEVSPIVTTGSVGKVGSAGAVRFRAPVKSPVTPRRQAVRFGHLDAEAGLDEAQHRGVVQGAGALVAAEAERRDHQRRDAEAQADRAGDAAGRRQRCRGQPLARRCPAGAVGGGDVVEEAAVLVVDDEQHGPGPHLGVRHQRVPAPPERSTRRTTAARPDARTAAPAG